MTRLCVFFLLIIEPLFDRACHGLVTTISLFGDRGSRSNWYLSRYIAVLSGNSERAAVPPGNGIPDERAPARTAGGIEEYFHRVVQFSAPGGSSTRPGRGVGSISGCACPRIRSSGCKVFNLNIIQSEPPRTDIYLFAFVPGRSALGRYAPRLRPLSTPYSSYRHVSRSPQTWLVRRRAARL